MSDSVDQAFEKEYASSVHIAYQRQGTKLRNTVRTQNKVKGSSCVFHKVGKGAASTKARHGIVPTMNVSHEAVECFLKDFYAGDWVDKLDELKTNADERQIQANAGAYALGRKTDELIIAEMDKSTNLTATTTGGLTKAKVLEAFEAMGEADVPDDGERYAVVGWKQWSDLLDIAEFANADYVGTDQLPWKSTQAKRWLGTLWFPHSGLTVDGSSKRLCHWYHRTALGHAIGADVDTDITWHGERAAHFVNNYMSQGTVLIDGQGIVTMPCEES
ncbi:MAG: phage capsid protein [Minwuia sp.]|uniref:phage capsid protein n=1 Tax=Minwuia sp. TaxID=2493630 RepID=UPI003A89D84B